MASQSTGAVTTCWKATCTICYDEIFLDAREEEDRPVCAVGCGHVYHMKCILRWITTNPTCPQCMLHLTAQSLQRIIVDVEKVLVPVAAGGSAVNPSATGRGPAGDSAGATAAINSTTSLPQSSTSASSSVTAEARAREIEELLEENRALTARVRTLEKRTKDMEEETQTLHFLVNEREQRDQNHTNSQPASAPSNRGTTSSPLRSSSFTSSYGAGPSTSFGHRTHSHFPIVHPSGHHAFHYPSSYGTPHHGPPFGYTNRRLRPASYGDSFNFTTAEEQWSFPNFNGIVAPLSTSPPPLQPPPSAPRRRLHSQQSMTSGSTGTHGTPRPTLTVTRSSSTTNLSTTVPIPTMGPIPASLRPLLPDEYAEHEEFLRTFGSQVQQASAEQAPQPSSSDSSPSVQQDSTSSSNQPSSIGAAVADPSSASNPTPGGAVSAAPWSSTQQQPPAPSSPMGFGYGRSGLYIPTSGEPSASHRVGVHRSSSASRHSDTTTFSRLVELMQRPTRVEDPPRQDPSLDSTSRHRINCSCNRCFALRRRHREATRSDSGNLHNFHREASRSDSGQNNRSREASRTDLGIQDNHSREACRMGLGNHSTEGLHSGLGNQDNHSRESSHLGLGHHRETSRSDLTNQNNASEATSVGRSIFDVVSAALRDGTARTRYHHHEL